MASECSSSISSTFLSSSLAHLWKENGHPFQLIMQQAAFSMRSKEFNTLENARLCLLSLDGGGVRGLSTLYILKALMDQLNHERADRPVKPCDIFDLIGGTSTGGYADF
jgi:hypothetical protein